MILQKIPKGLYPLAIFWLVILGGFFFTSYGFANWVTSQKVEVSSFYFNWEKNIPLWGWSIVPYWSLDLLYGLAFLLCINKQTLNTLVCRLLSLQIICVGFFLLFPLRFAFERPQLGGIFGLLFDLLMGFDKPFNQAPSLHIAISVVLWGFYIRYFSRKWHLLISIWFLLIGVSVLTTWQHHFIDVPTGILVGCFCIWLWTLGERSPLCIKQPPKQWLWAFAYLVGAFLLFIIALILSSWALWLCWPAFSLLLVSLNYSFIGAKGFQKQQNGRYLPAIFIMYLPYIVIMWCNSRIWTRNNHHADNILENVYLGRIPSKNVIKRLACNSIVDLCAELPIYVPKHCDYHLFASLDMTPLTKEKCIQAAKCIETANQKGAVLVCCGLGYSRSTTVVIAWLILTKRAPSVEDAILMVKKARPSIVLSMAQINILRKIQ